MREIQKEVHELAVDNGWWEGADVRIVPEKLALIHSEISEALEEYRDGQLDHTYYRESDGKPEGFAVELADAIIRIFDLAEWLGFDMDEYVRLKHDFNKSRPFRHGGKLA